MDSNNISNDQKEDFFDEMVKNKPYYRTNDGELAIEEMFFETESPQIEAEKE